MTNRIKEAEEQPSINSLIKANIDLTTENKLLREMLKVHLAAYEKLDKERDEFAVTFPIWFIENCNKFDTIENKYKLRGRTGFFTIAEVVESYQKSNNKPK